MSTPEQPGSPPLTRRRIREIRNTGATPIITPEDLAEAESDAESAVAENAAADAAATEAAAAPVPAPLPRAAEPVVVHDAPAPDASVDLGVSPLTRRQARQQERIRTASVPVITPELLAANAVQDGPIDSVPSAAAPVEASPETEAPAEENVTAEEPAEDIFQAPAADDAVELVEVSEVEESDHPEHTSAEDDAPVASDDDIAAFASEEIDGRAVVSPQLGADLLESEPVEVTLPPTFDQLLSRSSSGSTATPNALIVSQTTGSSPLIAPVAATGEVLITGTFNLPEGLGSLGHTRSTADGKEVDSVLVDGELPAHSSPTPIAASAAISTVKSSGEIIKPPAPEKGNKLMVSLAITAGILAAALLGVLTVAMISGVF